MKFVTVGKFDFRDEDAMLEVLLREVKSLNKNFIEEDEEPILGRLIASGNYITLHQLYEASKFLHTLEQRIHETILRYKEDTKNTELIRNTMVTELQGRFKKIKELDDEILACAHDFTQQEMTSQQEGRANRLSSPNKRKPAVSHA